MHIAQEARLAANQARRKRLSQVERNNIATLLEEIASQFEELEANASAKETAADLFEQEDEKNASKARKKRRKVASDRSSDGPSSEE